MIASVPETEVARLLGYPPGRVLSGEARALSEAARAWCIEHARPTVREKLQDDEVVVATSSGFEVEREIERLTERGDVVEAAFLDRFGAALVEWLVHTTEHELRERFAREGLGVLPPRSPGHEDWDLADQPRLFAAFGDDPGALELLPSGMLRPRNAILSVFGLTREQTPETGGSSVHCSRCSWSPCAFRHGRSPLPPLSPR